MSGELWQLGRMGPKDCAAEQVADMKEVKALQGNHSGRRLRMPDHAEDSPPNGLPATNKNLNQYTLLMHLHLFMHSI